MLKGALSACLIWKKIDGSAVWARALPPIHPLQHARVDRYLPQYTFTLFIRLHLFTDSIFLDRNSDHNADSSPVNT